MGRMPKAALLLLVALAVACAAPQAPRDRADAKRGMEETRGRVPYLPMVPEEVARGTMPGWRGKRVPDLVRIAAHMPKAWTAEMAAWKALNEEGTLDRRLLSEVFYVVSSANDCFYCMGHTVMTSELGGIPEEDVLRIEETKDPMRQTVFRYARKAAREPASVTREDVKSLSPYLSVEQIVELDLAICRYCTMNRLALVFGVPLEKENVFKPEPRESPVPITSGAGPVVNAVRGTLVGISVGSADGVKLGDIYTLSRGTQFVGRIVITTVDKNQSVGEFDPRLPSPGAPPLIGDKATPGATE